MIEVDVAPRRTKIAAPAGEPARYLVLGDFGGRRTDIQQVDRDSINDVLSILHVNAGGMQIRDLDDFHPDRLFQRLEMGGADPHEAEAKPELPATPQADIAALLRPTSLLDRIAEGSDPFEQYVKDLARAHSAPQKKSVDRSAAYCERMNGLLHHPRFQALESVWRGVDFAIRQMDDVVARIHIAQFSKEDLIIDLASDNLRATRLYALLHSRRWTAAIGLFSFVEHEIELMARIALVAADASVPFLSEGSPGIAAELFRDIPEASHLGLALPRLLLRLPYGSHTSPIDSFAFEEMPGAPVHQHYLWGNGALACLAVLARGEAENLNLDGLPAHTYKQDTEWIMTPCAELFMTETQVLALIDQGLMPLISYRDRPLVRLAGFRAINGKSLPFSVPF
ncbi:MAG TPA: type VI secretion system contractile sheath large subunit [Bryobacteraceae bacterium]|jgi:type VI secretion system protein ImpC|nr:type VI secretion system contractile sheath large subunit [Bryobacteraceae bacterium]